MYIHHCTVSRMLLTTDLFFVMVAGQSHHPVLRSYTQEHSPTGGGGGELSENIPACSGSNI